MFYLCIKFVVSSFNRFGYIFWGKGATFKMGHVTMTMPPWGIVYHVTANTLHGQSFYKFEVSSFDRSRDISRAVEL